MISMRSPAAQEVTNVNGCEGVSLFFLRLVKLRINAAIQPVEHRRPFGFQALPEVWRR